MALSPIVSIVSNNGEKNSNQFIRYQFATQNKPGKAEEKRFIRTLL